MLLTPDPYETLILRERPPLKKRSAREERHLHECFLLKYNTQLKRMKSVSCRSQIHQVKGLQVGFCIFSSRLSTDTKGKKSRWDNWLDRMRQWLIPYSKLTNDTWKCSVKVDVIKASPAQIPKHWSSVIGFLCCTDTRETFFFQHMTNPDSFIYLFNFQSRVIFNGSIIQKLFN